MDYLKRIQYGGDGWADSVQLPTYGSAKVVVDPKIAFGPRSSPAAALA